MLDFVISYLLAFSATVSWVVQWIGFEWLAVACVMDNAPE